jgi:sugar phosphate isomerase/epimerase
MKHILPITAAILTLFGTFDPAHATPEFFAFDNGVGRGTWTPEQQAKTLKELGFDGIGYNYTNPEDLAHWQKTYKEQGLKIFSIYAYTSLDGQQPYDARLPEAIKMLKGTDTVLWITIQKPKAPGDHDAAAVRIVQQVADLANESGVKVALYGHFGFYVETGSDSARIVKLAARPNLGASINLCHEFYSGHGDQLDESVKAAAPISILASINGMDVPNKKYILRLDQGTYDTAAYVKKLLGSGYKGPVGLQCYSVEGDITENLKADIAAWKKIAGTLEKP